MPSCCRSAGREGPASTRRIPKPSTKSSSTCNRSGRAVCRCSSVRPSGRSGNSVTDSETVNLEIMIEASPETVFEFFVDPGLMRTWMGDHAVLEPRVGGSFAVDIGNNHVRGSFVDLQPPERVVFTWGWEGSDI